MRIRAINIRGFGRLSEKQFELVDGINLFFGPNEAGKSTLQQAILAFLYGFYQSSRKLQAEEREHERFRPWQGGAYGGTLRYTLDNGQEFEIRRDFSSEDIPTQILDPVTGRDHTQSFPRGRHGNIPFAREHLGMGRDIFEASAFVRQAEVRRLNQAKNLGADIVSILDTGSPNASAQMAVNLLEKKIGEIGSDKAWKRLLPQKRQELTALQREKQAVEEARHSLRQALIEKQQWENRLQALKRQWVEYRFLIIGKRMTEIESTLHRVTEIQKRLKELTREIKGLRDVAHFDPSSRDDILKKLETRRNLLEHEAELKEEMKKIQARQKEISEEMASYQGYHKVIQRLDAEHFQELRANWIHKYRTLQEVRQTSENLLEDVRTQGVDPERVSQMAQLRESELEDIGELQKELDEIRQQETELEKRYLDLSRQYSFPTALKAPLLSIGIIAISLGLILAFIGYPLWGGLLGLVTIGCGILYGYFLRKERGYWRAYREFEQSERELHQRRLQTEQQLHAYLSPYGVSNYHELLHQRLRWGKYVQALNEKQKTEIEFQAIERTLLDYLRPLNIKQITEEKLDEVAGYLRKFQSLEEESLRLEEEYEEKRSQYEQRLRNRRQLERSLRALFDAAQISESNLDTCFQIYEEKCRRHRDYDARQTEMDQLCRQRQEILGQKSIGELEEELKALAKEQEKLLGNFPFLKGKESPLPLRKLEEKFKAINSQREGAEKRLEGYRATIETVLEKHRPLAELEEEIAIKKQEIRRLENFRRALEIARDTIQEVSEEFHRNFAPFLNRVISQGIAHVTQDRYRRVLIDPSNFSIQLEAPETQQVVPAELLSLGTQEQLYLLLRIGIARLLSTSGETIPLILDDPFVHFDPQRLKNMLQFLVELSKEHQILLFTKDPTIWSWFQKKALPPDRFRAYELEQG